MVSVESVEQQFKKLGFNYHRWGKAECLELPNILLPDEEIYECVNGIYEGGFALLVATDVRLLLVDKKPLNYLTVEDLRYDMVNEIDYSHRLMGAQINITTGGSKQLRFRSYNQPRLRKLISHVQHCIAEAKKQQSDHQMAQKQHLGEINQQLQAYLLAQHHQQEDLRRQLQEVRESQSVALPPQPEPVKPSAELSDYLYAQSLLLKHQEETGKDLPPLQTVAFPEAAARSAEVADLYAAGVEEVFGKHQITGEQSDGGMQPVAVGPSAPLLSTITPSSEEMMLHEVDDGGSKHGLPLELNALRIAYSRLPMAMRNRKFSRPSLPPAGQPAPAVRT